METKIKDIISAMLGIDIQAIDNSTGIDTVENWDSLNHMNLITAFEDEFSLKFSDNQIINMTNYPEIISTIEEYIKNE